MMDEGVEKRKAEVKLYKDIAAEREAQAEVEKFTAEAHRAHEDAQTIKGNQRGRRDPDSSSSYAFGRRNISRSPSPNRHEDRRSWYVEQAATVGWMVNRSVQDPPPPPPPVRGGGWEVGFNVSHGASKGISSPMSWEELEYVHQGTTPNTESL